MNIYRTSKFISLVGEEGNIFSKIIMGELIFATSHSHAVLSLSQKGMGDFTASFYMKQFRNKKSPVEWDSLILPNNLQLN